MGGSLAWNLRMVEQSALDATAAAAQTVIEKDLAFRKWGASHGGVYVPVDAHTPPNPYLSLPNRDVVTQAGQALTLMNSSYMLRQMQEDFIGESGVRSHVTSLRPLNPHNAPDAWETAALRGFERERKERMEVLPTNGAPALRLIKPITVSKECLKCHAPQGYKVGDVYGGIGVTVPLAPYVAQERGRRAGLIASHGGLWLIGLLALAFWLRRDYRRIAALRLSAGAFASAHDGIFITTADGSIVDANSRFCEITGYTRDEVLGKNPRILKSGRHDDAFYAALWRSLTTAGYWEGELWNRRKNGEVYPELLSINRLTGAGGKTTHYVGVVTDISFLKQQQDRLEHLAYHDALTQLPNRMLFSDRLAVAMAQVRRENGLLGVVYLDLDGFKPVNDSYGHSFGDRLLVEIAGRLQQALRGGDSVARIGGDEFVLLLNKLNSQAECENILHRLLQTLAAPVVIDGKTAAVTGSAGVTLFPDDDADADTLLRHADHALYLAKEGGRNRFHVFDTLHDHEVRARHDGRQRVEAALAANELRLHYQPKVDMRQGRVVGVEALIRWQHPEMGLLTPVAFLTFIENTPADAALGEWVIREALHQSSVWRDWGLDLPISVNISAYHLARQDFVPRLKEMIAACPGLPAGSLEIEILETAALDDVVHVVALMGECRALGVDFALDDFGTGYSSLAYFKRLPVDTLKVDQGFVRDMLTDGDDLAIVAGVIGMARAFQREVIAEGVETSGHGARLLQMGCHLAQGYGVARPMPPEAIPDWVAGWRPDRAWALAGGDGP